MRISLLLMVCLSLMLAGCPRRSRTPAPPSVQAQQSPAALTTAAAGESVADRKVVLEVRQAYCDYSDAIQAAKRAGEQDYLGLVAGALCRDRQAMARLLKLTLHPEFASDQARADHDEILWAVLCDVGDRFFASCLAENPTVTPAVRLHILTTFAGEEKPPYTQALDDIRGTFPKTFPESYHAPDPNAPKQSSGSGYYDDGTDDDNLAPCEEEYPVA